MNLNVTDIAEVLRRGLHDPAYKDICTVLGVQYSRWATSLALLVVTSDITGPMVEASAPVPACCLNIGAWDNDRLLLSQRGVPNAGAPFVLTSVWPYEPTVRVTYAAPDAVNLVYGDRTYKAAGKVTGARMTVEWPEELNIVGDIDLTGMDYTRGFELRLQTAEVYPAQRAFSMLKRSGAIYHLPDEVVSAAASIGTAEDSLAIIAHALYKSLHG